MEFLNSSNVLLLGTLFKMDNINNHYTVLIVIAYIVFTFLNDSIDKTNIKTFFEIKLNKLINLFMQNNIVSTELTTHNVTYTVGYNDKIQKKKIYSTDFIALLDYIKTIDIPKKKEILTTQLKDTSWANRWDDKGDENDRYQFIPKTSIEDIIINKDENIYLKISNRPSLNEKEEQTGENDLTATIYTYYVNDLDKDKKIQKLNNFLSKIKKIYLDKITKKDDKQYIYVYQKTENVDEETKLLYSEHLNIHNKNFSNVVIDNKDKLINYVRKFKSEPDNKVIEDFKKMGMPYKAGMLFWGSPGTGKTSTIKAILKETNRHGIIINLSNIESNKELESIFRNRKINNKTYDGNQLCFILEDCDATKLSSIKERDEKPTITINEDKKEKSLSDEIKNIITVQQKGFDLSCFLNILDGIIELYGVMIIVTTNHPDKIDEALIRPGRIDFKYEFKKSSRKNIIEMLKLKYDFNNNQMEKYMNDLNKIQDYIMSPAEIQCIMFQNDSIEDTIHDIIVKAQKLIN